MKKHITILIFILKSIFLVAQSKAPKEAPVPCADQADADRLPGKYKDHTQSRYRFNLKGTAQDRVTITKTLIELEKLEEASRKDFQLTGCVAEVSGSGGENNSYGGYLHTSYGYQLGIYQNVCHVTEHIVKMVGEYRTVLRVTINPCLATGGYMPAGVGDFYLTDKNRSVRYEIPFEAIQGINYTKDRNERPSRISMYVTEDRVLAHRSDDYKNKHSDFLKIINGDGFVENWYTGSRYDKVTPTSYQLIDRHWMITRPGIPLVVPVSRKQYLEDLVEYFEIEKANFNYSLAEKIKIDTKDGSDNAKKRLAVYEADKDAYPKLYEARNARIKELLTTKSADWLQKQAIIPRNSDDLIQRVQNMEKFFDIAADNQTALYSYNPEYFKVNIHQPVKPVLIEVQFRYELRADRGFSARLFNNFVKNYDRKSLAKMLE